MDSPQLPSTVGTAVVKLLCLDQIRVVTSIRNLESIKGSAIGWKKKYIKNDLLTLKEFIDETRSTEDVINRWIIKAAPTTKLASTPQLILHVDYYMKLLGFELAIERAAKTFKTTMDDLKKDGHTKDGKWILQQYKEARAKQLHKDPQLLATRIQTICDIPIETMIAKACAVAMKIGLALVAPEDPFICSVCSLIGHHQNECSLGEVAAAHGLFESEELRQQFQNDLVEMIEEMNHDDKNSTSHLSIQTRKREQSKSKSTSAPEEVEVDFDNLFYIGGAEKTTKEREQISFNSSESANENGGEYYSAASRIHRFIRETSADVSIIPEEDTSSSHSTRDNHEALVVQRGDHSESSHSDLSKFTYKGGSTFSESPKLPSQHQYSDHEEYEMEDEPETHSSDSVDIFAEPSRQRGSLPCQVLTFHRRKGQYIQTKVYARFWEDNTSRQLKIGDIMQIYGKTDQKTETRQGIIQAAEAIKNFNDQSKGALVPTVVNFFHSCKDFTKDFDDGHKEPYEEIQRIISDGQFPIVYIQETESSTTRIDDDNEIANKLYKEWSHKSPKFRKLNRQEDQAHCTDDDQNEFSFVRKCNFVVLCCNQTGSSAVNIFARQEDKDIVRLRTLRNDYATNNLESKELSIKVSITQACHEITSFIQRSDTSAQIGEILIVQGSEDIELDLKLQQNSYVFRETHEIITRTTPTATIWFMQARIEEIDYTNIYALSSIFWNWFKSKERQAFPNPAQNDGSLQTRTSAQEAESTSDRSSKVEGYPEDGAYPLTSSSFQ